MTDEMPEDLPEKIRELLRSLLGDDANIHMIGGGPSTYGMKVMADIATLDLVSSAVEREQNGRPAQIQYDLKPGDVGYITHYQARFYQDMIMVQLLDPAEHNDQFPDWEKRVQNGYVLCAWKAATDRDGGLGWFSRFSVIPLDPKDYQSVLDKFQDPSWEHVQTIETYAREYPNHDAAYRRTLAGQITLNEECMHPVLCTECGSTNMVLDLIRHSTGSFTVVAHTHAGQTRYQARSTDAEVHSTTTTLRCIDCGATAEIDPDSLEGFDG